MRGAFAYRRTKVFACDSYLTFNCLLTISSKKQRIFVESLCLSKYSHDVVAPRRNGFGWVGNMQAERRLSNGLLQKWLERRAAMASGAVQVNSYRSIWISDLHLGIPGCKAEALLDFLRHHEAENLYLVGDIVDGWNLGASWSWGPAQSAVVEEIVAWRRRGVRVELLPGNHDELNSDIVENLFGLAPSRTELIHRTVEGRRMLVIHGHQFDSSLASGWWLKGNQAYTVALRIHQWYRREWDERWHRPRSLSSYLKCRVKKAVEYITDFDDRSLFEAARQHKADGVICGHIHRAEQRLIGPIWYINDGDWVENRTALVEDHDGSLRLLRWGSIGSQPAESESIVPQEAS
jgi:UDP-2,3-diacylglucosamine pyrophosphatase LpxH